MINERWYRPGGMGVVPRCLQGCPIWMRNENLQILQILSPIRFSSSRWSIHYPISRIGSISSCLLHMSHTNIWEDSSKMIKTVMMESFLPLESVRLGRFIRHVKEPHSDYHDPECEVGPQIIVNFQDDYCDNKKRSQKEDQIWKVSSLLTRLASAARTKQTGFSTQIETKQTKTYQLANSGEWFKNAIRDPKLKEWIMESINQGDAVYLVVG